MVQHRGFFPLDGAMIVPGMLGYADLAVSCFCNLIVYNETWKRHLVHLNGSGRESGQPHRHKKRQKNPSSNKIIM